jgi:hypothetical protein
MCFTDMNLGRTRKFQNKAKRLRVSWQAQYLYFVLVKEKGGV